MPHQGTRRAADRTRPRAGNFRGLTEDQLTDLLSDFNDTLAELGEQHTVAVSPWWFDTECVDGRELYDVLYEGGTPQVGRDARLRMAGLMDRCPTWDTELPGLPDQVEISENVKELAWSVGYAWLQATRGHHVGCLVFPTADRHGWHPVSPVKGTHVGSGSGHVYFLAQPLELLDFWRSLFAKEDVAEADFFDRAEDAYPGLVFADSLSFGKFDGSYAEMRDWVVKALSVLNDYFSVALVKHAGQPEEI